MTLLNRLIREEDGQDLIEYVLLAAGIAIVTIPIVPQIGTTLITKYTNINTSVSTIGS